MSEKTQLSANGFLSAQEAAEISGLTRDYVARLCRTGKVRGRQAGRQWFVNKNAFHDFLILNEYERSKQRESLANQRRKDYERGSDVGPVPWRMAAETAAAAGLTSTSEDSNPINAAFGSLLNAPSGLANAALQTTHIPVYAITPFMEVIHRLVALLCAVLVIFGAYTLVNPGGSLEFVRTTGDTFTASATGLLASLDTSSQSALSDVASVASAANTSGIYLFDHLMGR